MWMRIDRKTAQCRSRRVIAVPQLPRYRSAAVAALYQAGATGKDLPAIVFPLVPDSDDVHCTVRVDLEECDIARGPERDDEISQKWIVGTRFATRER